MGRRRKWLEPKPALQINREENNEDYKVFARIKVLLNVTIRYSRAVFSDSFIKICLYTF